jgi:hypothetical protein
MEIRTTMLKGVIVHSTGNHQQPSLRKKSISYFMPNSPPHWVSGAGNPTKSTAVNDFVKEIKKFEVRGEDRDGQAKRPLRPIEFRKTIELFRAEDDYNHKWKYRMMCLLEISFDWAHR